jgi:hypothetical protein
VGDDESDWTTLFGQWGLLLQDQKIGGIMRAIGWLGMLGTMAWLAFRVFNGDRSQAHSLKM